MPKVLLIGWDGAGWTHIHPLLDSGAMPNLCRMIERGIMGDLRTLTPDCSPLLWSSIATGKYADSHGILDALEPDPVTGGVRPATRDSLRAHQIWDILAHQGIRTQVIGWPATHPAQGPATCVSDGFAKDFPGSVYPPDLASEIGALRFHPREWTGDELHLFVPRMDLIDQDKDTRLAQLATILAEAVSVHAAATALLQTQAWDFTAVWFGPLRRAIELQSQSVDDIFKDVVDAVYRFLDLQLGRLLDLAGPNATIMLVSDRSAGQGSSGILCATSPGIEPDKLTFGGGLLDIAPTILGLFGYFPAPGMAGRMIPEICATQPGSLPKDLPVAATEPDTLSFDEAARLEQLGYRDTVGAAAKSQADDARKRREFHLAQVLLAQGRASEAIPLLESLDRQNPEVLVIRLYLGHAYFQAGRLDECRSVCDSVLDEHPESPMAPLARAHLAIASGNYAEAIAHLSSSHEHFGVTAALDTSVGEAYLRLQAWENAAAAFRSAITGDPNIVAAHHGLAQANLAAARYEEAAEAALDAIRLKYDFPQAHNTLGRALKALGRHDDAAGAFAAGARLRGAAAVE
jgi:tetratricopeptide (TPR) repeat protein